MKYIAFAVAGVLLLLVVFVAVTVVPSHLQVRSIEATIPSIEDIQKLKDSGVDGPTTVSFVEMATQSKGDTVIGHASVLVTWADGKQLLIDAGMDRHAANEFGKTLETLIGADPIEIVAPIKEQLMEAVNNITAIAFTHLHIDHTQGLTAICESQLKPATVFQSVTQSSEHNSFTEEGQQIISNSMCERKLFAAGDIKSFPSLPGVYAIAAGGHTPGSTIYIVVTEKQTWIFSGDLTNDFESITHNVGKGWIYSYLLIPEDTAKLNLWRIWLKAADDNNGITVLPAHDIKRMKVKLRQL